MKRLGFALVGLILLLVPGDALASLTLTSPADSTSLHANQTLTVSWTPDGDATANDAAPSYLLFTGTYWTTRITLNQAGIRAHSFSFRPNETVASLLANDGPNVLAAAVTPPIGSDYVLPGGVYAIDLFILDGTGGVHDRASAVGLNVVDQCGVGTYSLDGWPPCTQATPGTTSSPAGRRINCPAHRGHSSGSSATTPATSPLQAATSRLLLRPRPLTALPGRIRMSRARSRARPRRRGVSWPRPEQQQRYRARQEQAARPVPQPHPRV